MHASLIQSDTKRYEFVKKMPPKKKFRSIKIMKRKFTGNIYTQQQDSQQSAATVTDSSPEVSEATEVSNESCVVEPKIHVLASLRKLDLPSSSEDENDSPEGNEGFRLIDLAILAEIMGTFWCPDCRCSHEREFRIKKGICFTADSRMLSSELPLFEELLYISNGA